MLSIGITGQKGFIGTHLYNLMGLYPEEFKRIEFKRMFFDSEAELDKFVRQCDVIVHLAAINRHRDDQVVFQTNIALVKKLIGALKRTGCQAHVLFSSSLQEDNETPYGRSKKIGRELLAQWANESGALFTGMVIPNVFGPFGVPNYNSFIATFCHQLTHGRQPEINVDGTVKLIYVLDLAKAFLEKIEEGKTILSYRVPHSSEFRVSEVLAKLENFKTVYFERGEIPTLESSFDLNLFNTFRSYIDYGTHFPVKFVQHTDSRGSFVEIIKLGMGGQVSFSTTLPGVTRGNHYHTRKIERFAVIKGKALIQLRRIGTSQVLNFEIDGKEPAYVDMPIWYTHNIKNVGNDTLYTNFWINEPYKEEQADTYFEEV